MDPKDFKKSFDLLEFGTKQLIKWYRECRNIETLNNVRCLTVLVTLFFCH